MGMEKPKYFLSGCGNRLLNKTKVLFSYSRQGGRGRRGNIEMVGVIVEYRRGGRMNNGRGEVDVRTEFNRLEKRSQWETRGYLLITL